MGLRAGIAELLRYAIPAKGEGLGIVKILIPHFPGMTAEEV